MAFKILIFCAAALLIQTISAQIINGGSSCNGAGLQYVSSGLGLSGNGYGLSGSGLGSNGNLGNSLNNGGGFIVTSTSPIQPTGISVLADNLLIEGPLTIDGSLPILATVSLQGELPTSGQASTTYSCGNGNIGITSQNGAAGGSVGNGAGLGNYGAIGAGSAGIGYGGAGSNCGANRAY